jgi:hypothetical protein
MSFYDCLESAYIWERFTRKHPDLCKLIGCAFDDIDEEEAVK